MYVSHACVCVLSAAWRMCHARRCGSMRCCAALQHVPHNTLRATQRCNVAARVATWRAALQHGGARYNVAGCVATWRRALQRGGARCNVVAWSQFGADTIRNAVHAAATLHDAVAQCDFFFGTHSHTHTSTHARAHTHAHTRRPELAVDGAVHQLFAVRDQAARSQGAAGGQGTGGVPSSPHTHAPPHTTHVLGGTGCTLRAQLSH
jgi:hypothetical protein